VKRKILLSITFSLAALLILVLFCGRNAGKWLVVEDTPPGSLDLLFTLGGDLDRFSYAKELIGEYPDAVWLVSTGRFPVFDTISLGEAVRRNIALEGFDTSRVIVNDTCISTRSEIDMMCHTLDSLRAAGFRDKKEISVGIVTSPYHSRRAVSETRRHCSDSDIIFYSLPVPLDQCVRMPHHPDRWWRYRIEASFVITELIKLIYYRIEY
jgi:uncharacterized SAM-binding protein YcdF (DUF218 family)